MFLSHRCTLYLVFHFFLTRRHNDAELQNLPSPSKHLGGELYQRILEDLHLAGMADRTIFGYLRAVKQLADVAKKTPDKINETDVRQWLKHLKVDQQRACGTLRVAFSGIKFFFTRTCRRDWKTLADTKLQNVKALPDVLTIARSGKRGHSSLQTTRVLKNASNGKRFVFFGALPILKQSSLSLDCGCCLLARAEEQRKIDALELSVVRLKRMESLGNRPS